jgi:uncharacterized protein with ParB-like and HNH nuclease domain
MQPTKQTIANLFQPTKRHVIPLFQRAYVWNEDDHWEPLWSDVRRQAERALVNKPLGHFLGSVVVQNEPVVGVGLPRAQLIDGQQRLSTLQVLLQAITDRASENGSAWTETFRNLTRNQLTPGAAEEEVFKVWPGQADRAAFISVMSGNGDPAVGRTKLIDAHRFFYSEVQDFLLDTAVVGTAEEKFNALYSALTVGLQLIVLELEATDDPQLIFETLNARGQPLLPSDLIRNDLFLRATTNPGANSDQLYDKYWRRFDETEEDADSDGETRFWHKADFQGRLRRPRIDQFIFHYLAMKNPGERRIDRLYTAFRDWARDQEPDVIQLFKDISAYGNHYLKLIAPAGNDKLASTARRLRALETTTAYPVLLYILGLPSERLSAAELHRVLTALESYLVRRFFIGGTSKSYNKVFVSLLEAVQSKVMDDQPIGEIVETELLKSQGASAEWPSDEAFLAGWLKADLYVSSRLARTRMVLEALEDELRLSTLTEPMVRDAQLTIEHLLPQGAKLIEYPFPEKPPEGYNEAKPEDTRGILIHTVGNLSLLTQNLNTLGGNRPFPVKSKEIGEHSDLRLNAFLRHPDKQIGWDEHDIVNRGKVLFELAKNIWPRPPSL